LGEGTSFWAPGLAPSGSFVHVDLDDTVFGAAYPQAPTLGVQSDVRAFVAKLLAAWPSSTPAVLPPVWGKLHARPAPAGSLRESGLVRGSILAAALQSIVVEGSDAIVMADSGNSSLWGTHCLRFDTPGRYRVSPGIGSMSHASTGVLGAALGSGRVAVALVGDGSMLMQNEVSTAVAHRVPAVWVVLNDARYGMVADGLRGLGWEPFATDIPRADFAALARAVGALGIRVEREADVAPALKQALVAGRPVVIDVLIDVAEPPPQSLRVGSLTRQGVNGRTCAGSAV
jgi:acetolactate synthase-1/2/3 large subunit